MLLRYIFSTALLSHAIWILVLLSAVLAIISELRVEIEVDVTNCTERAEEGDTILLTYNGTFENGSSFDATEPGGSINLTLGPRLIEGFNLGLYGACIGQTRRIFVPHRLGYGDAGGGDAIPPRTDIIFLVEVLDIFKHDYAEEFTYENTTEFVTDSGDIEDFDIIDDTDADQGKDDSDGKNEGNLRNDHVRRRRHRGRPFWWYVQFLAIPVLLILLIVDAYYLYKIYFPHGRVKFYKELHTEFNKGHKPAKEQYCCCRIRLVNLVVLTNETWAPCLDDNALPSKVELARFGNFNYQSSYETVASSPAQSEGVDKEKRPKLLGASF